MRAADELQVVQVHELKNITRVRLAPHFRSYTYWNTALRLVPHRPLWKKTAFDVRRRNGRINVGVHCTLKKHLPLTERKFVTHLQLHRSLRTTHNRNHISSDSRHWQQTSSVRRCARRSLTSFVTLAPKSHPAPLGEMAHVSTSSGSDHTRSQKAPLCGISWFRSMVRIWSRVLRSGERPPCTHRMHSSMICGASQTFCSATHSHRMHPLSGVQQRARLCRPKCTLTQRKFSFAGVAHRTGRTWRCSHLPDEERTGNCGSVTNVIRHRWWFAEVILTAAMVRRSNTLQQ